MISIIVAYAKNKVIGNKGKIPWFIKKDLEHFKKLTSNNIVIMGKNTFEEIKKPLANRINVIVSKTIYRDIDTEKEKYENYIRYEELLKLNKKDICIDKLYVVKCLSDAIFVSRKIFGPDKEIFLAGGERIFKEGLAIADKMYITEIDKEFDGDRCFPSFEKNQYEKVIEEEVEGDLSYKFVVYLRRK